MMEGRSKEAIENARKLRSKLAGRHERRSAVGKLVYRCSVFRARTLRPVGRNSRRA